MTTLLSLLNSYGPTLGGIFIVIGFIAGLYVFIKIKQTEAIPPMINDVKLPPTPTDNTNS